MKIKVKPKDLGDNPVLTLWNDLLDSMPIIILVAGICALVLLIDNKFGSELGCLWTILAFICETILKVLGMAVVSMILSIILNAILIALM